MIIILGILPAHRMCCWNVKLENTEVNSRLKMRFILFPSLQLIRIIKTFCRTGFWYPMVNILNIKPTQPSVQPLGNEVETGDVIIREKIMCVRMTGQCAPEHSTHRIGKQRMCSYFKLFFFFFLEIIDTQIIISNFIRFVDLLI